MSTFPTRKAICEIFHKLSSIRRSTGFLIFTFGRVSALPVDEILTD